MQSRRTLGFLLLLVLFNGLLWWAILYHQEMNRQAALDAFLEIERIMVGEAAMSTEKWASSSDTRALDSLVKGQPSDAETFELIIRPLKLLGQTNTWLIVNGRLAYESGSLFAKAYLGRTVDEIFEEHREQGASHFDRLLRGLEKGNQDSDWFILSAERGREYASWASLSVGDDIWTIGISTPEEDILSAFIAEERGFRETAVGTVGSLLILTFLGVALRLSRKNARIIRRLEKEIADRAEVELALRESDNRYKRLFMDSNAVQLIIDAETAQIVDANGAASRYYGYSQEKLKTMKMSSIMTQSPKEIQSEMTRSRSENRAYFHFRHRLASGAIRDVEAYSSPLRVHDRNLVYAIIHDVTERHRMEQQIKHMGNHDPLTGLPNRTLLMDRLTVAIEHAKRVSSTLAILFIDLDDFKPINDELGHNAGDQLLTMIAQRFQSAIRRSDTVARFGGDEFVLLLSGGELDEATAAQVAEKTFKALEKPFSIDGHLVRIGCSIGISLYPRDGASVEELIAEADRAMYVAKQSGTNHYRFVTDSDDQELAG